jgi:hypothetical protein
VIRCYISSHETNCLIGESVSVLHQISGCENAARLADVVFVHGLGGHAFETWSASKDPASLWPSWLGEEFPQIGVWSLGYAASPTKLMRFNPFTRVRDAGYGMPLATRATQVLDRMAQKNLGDRPLFFISHSLGGLLVKQILRSSYDEVDQRKKRIFAQTRAVLFLATPHAGAGLASFVSAFRLIFNATVTVQDLKAHDANLSNLYDWYRTKTVAIHTRCYYEQRELYGFTIVNSTSAHPGSGDTPVGLDEDHLSIAKPGNKYSQVYDAARDILRDFVLNEENLASRLAEAPINAEVEAEIVRVTRIRDANDKNWYGPIRPVACLDVWIKYSGKGQLFLNSVRLCHLETSLVSASSGTFPASHRYNLRYKPGGILDKDLDPPLLINPSDQAEIHFELELFPTRVVGGCSCCVVFLTARNSGGASARVPLLSPRPEDLVLARVLDEEIIVDIAYASGQVQG